METGRELKGERALQPSGASEESHDDHVLSGY